MSAPLHGQCVSAFEHGCEAPEVYVVHDVTVWVRLQKNGKLGAIRDRKADLTQQAHETIYKGDDLVCATCGWMGRL